MAKVAQAAGLSAPAFAFWQALGAGLCLAAGAIASRQPVFDRHLLRYSALAGLTGIALPNLFIYLAVARLGAGLAGLSFAFPPLFTMALAALLGMERLTLRRASGITLGLCGVLMIAVPRGGLPASADPLGLLFALLAPLSLAVGNVYRSRAWPPGAHPLPLAAGMLLAGAAELLPAVVLTSGGPPQDGSTALPLAAAVLATAVAYVLFFQLQRLAGPVYLSQVGFVITPTSLVLGMLLLGERYGPWVWAAMAIVFAGVALTGSQPPGLGRRGRRAGRPQGTGERPAGLDRRQGA